MSLKLPWVDNYVMIFEQRGPVYFTKYFLVVWGVLFFFIGGCSRATHPTDSSLPSKVYSENVEISKSSIKAMPYRVGKTWYYPMIHAGNFRQQGIASWYGEEFHGRKTSNGEIYNMYGMTAAHKTLPLGTYVRVRHLENGKSIDVKINDRGPFVRERIIDLSFTAAQKIGIIGSGTGPVEIVAIGKDVPFQGKTPAPSTYEPVDYSKGNFTIQIGAFTDKNNALRLKKKLADSYKDVYISTIQNGDDTLYRVRVGKCATIKEAEEYEQALIKSEFTDAMIVAE